MTVVSMVAFLLVNLRGTRQKAEVGNSGCLRGIQLAISQNQYTLLFWTIARESKLKKRIQENDLIALGLN